MFFLVWPRLVIEFISDFFYFPLWWYTGGVIYSLNGCANLIGRANGFLAPGMWLKNIFVPMFGQNDLQGRLVSFFMRGSNVIFRSLLLLFWLVFVVGLFCLWVFAPIFVAYMFLISMATS